MAPWEIVWEKLDLEDFVSMHKSEIYSKIEECCHKVMQKKDEGTLAESEDFLMFMSQTLPFISSVIQVGSSLDNFTAAVSWVRGKMPSADAVPVISALTFYALVEQVWEEEKQKECTKSIYDEIHSNPDKKDLWEQIHDRVKKLV